MTTEATGVRGASSLRKKQLVEFSLRDKTLLLVGLAAAIASELSGWLLQQDPKIFPRMDPLTSLGVSGGLLAVGAVLATVVGLRLVSRR